MATSRAHLVFVLCLCGTLVTADNTAITTRDPVAAVRFLEKRLSHAGKYLSGVDVPSAIATYKKKMLQTGFGYSQLAENASICAHSIIQFGNDLRKFDAYALKMLDSWGKLQSGIETGNMAWLGRYYECQQVNTKNFDGKWCEIIIGSPNNDAFGIGAQTILAVGSCMPSTCSQDEINELFQPFPQVTQLPIGAYCPVQPTKYTSVDIVALFIVSLLGAFLLASTLFDLHQTYLRDEKYERLLNDVDELPTTDKRKNSVFIEILLAFSIIKNTKLILDTKQKEGNINVLHGLRFISMTWVILGHTFIFIVQYIDNPLDFATYFVSNGSFLAIGNATFSVDTFFFLSGLLAGYLGLREMEKRNGKMGNVPLMYLYRYMRLTPVYALCILVTSSFYSKFGDGPMWPPTADAVRKSCSSYWWTNLLYINNLHPTTLTEECFGHGWYLANDTQFFLLCPLMLWILYKKPKIGAGVLFFIVFASIASTFGASFHYKEQPQAVGIALLCRSILSAFSSNGTHSSDVSLEGTLMNVTTTPAPTGTTTSQSDAFWSDIYAKPWYRMGVYFIGMSTGYVIQVTRGRIYLKKYLVVITWMITVIVGVTVIYGICAPVLGTYAIPNWAAALYNAISRPLWGVCLSWLVIASVAGYGGPINSFLSWKLFIPLSRLTYCAYLVHPFIIYWAYSTMERRMHFSITELVIQFLAFVLLAYAVAYVVSVSAEMPSVGILKILMRGGQDVKTVHQSEQTSQILNGTTDHTNA